MRTSFSTLGSEPTQVANTAVRDFDALYNEHFEFVWRSLRRLGIDPSWVEDAAQDTFVVVHRRLRDLSPQASPRAFLYGIAMRVAKDYHRRVRRKGTVPLDVESTLSVAAGPFDQTATSEAARLVAQFMATLDEDKRCVFALFALEEMSPSEVSEALGVKINTVYSRLRVARERFTAYLETAGQAHG